MSTYVNGSNGQHPSKRRVVVTGMGMITPLGHNVEESWAAILAGQSGIGPFTILDKGEHVSGGLCEVKNYEPTQFLSAREVRRSDRCQQFALIATKEAMAQAALPINDDNRERIGIYIGTGIGGITTMIDQEHTQVENGLRRLSPFAITMIMPNGSAGMISIDYGIQGPSNTFTSACASGNDAIGHALRAIRYGDIDCAIAGGTETALTDLAIGGFEKARAASQQSQNTPRPFDKNRDGLIMGEGAAMLVLETLESAQARGATILGELAGYGQTTDAYHITAPAEGGLGAARAMRLAMNDADITPADVDYVNAHGTGTSLNDSHETMAIKNALGEDAYRVAVSSTKSMTGHVLGATGAIESIFAIKAIENNILPPTINYETPDPECDLDYVPNSPRAARVDVVLNNAFGFGGHNAVLVFRRHSEEAS